MLSGDWRAPRRGRSTPIPAEPDLVVEDVETGWVGAVVRVEKAGGMHVVHLEDRRGRTKAFPLGARLPRRRGTGDAHPAAGCCGDRPRRRTARRLANGERLRGGRRRPRQGGERLSHLRRGPARRRARREGVGRRPARRGRGRRAHGRRGRPRRHHRRLPARARASARRPRRPPRAGHEGGAHRRAGAGVARPLPARQGRSATPTSTCGSRCAPSASAGSSGRSSRGAPRGSTASAPSSGWPHATQADIARAWKRILGTVRSYADLEPTLLASVEELIDFVTEPAA